MFLRRLRDIALVITSLLIIFFWLCVIWGYVHDSRDIISSDWSFFSLLSAVLLGILVWILNRKDQTGALAHRERVVFLLGGLLVGSLLWEVVIVIPNVVISRGRSRIAADIDAKEGIRAALANYAANSVGYAYPSAEHIRDYATLRTLVNQHEGSLPVSEARVGFRFKRYASRDTDNDGIVDDYVLILAPL
jgi:hypothetical protein